MVTQTKGVEEISSVVVRFAGDSGDGMQTVGEQFTDSSALMGNDISTFPDFPAEIRAPAGTLPGVSGFQIQFGENEILTPGDSPNALVAMNPAALKVNLRDLDEKGLLVVNSAAFTSDNLRKAGFNDNPLETGELEDKYHLVSIDITGLTKTTLENTNLTASQKLQCKNFFALGFMFWVYGRTLDYSLNWISNKWAKKPDVVDANSRVLKAGFYYGETIETMPVHFQVPKAKVGPGTYRKISGNEALVLGLVTASEFSKKNIVYGSYPITPASSILEGLAKYKNFGVKTVQAEDEISAIGIALGASFAGRIGITGTSGPGICLKAEIMGLAVITELPLVIINVQRGGPSTGLPTKTEQSDLLQVMYGRNGESPIPILAAQSPSDCFYIAIDAVRIALRYKTPVIILSDGFLATGAEPWNIPSIRDLPEINEENAKSGEEYIPYKRNPDTLARELAIPGTPGLEHRIGGLEKNEAGNVSYDQDNHDNMVRIRAAKVAKISDMIGPTPVNGLPAGELLVLGWGGTWGAITSAVNSLLEEGKSIASVHLRFLNPFPGDLAEILKNFKIVLIPEINMGQLSVLIKNNFTANVETFNLVKGRPFTVKELREVMLKYL